jgi:FHA domain
VTNIIADYVSDTGRLNLSRLMQNTAQISRNTFAAQVTLPLLVSRKLWDGELQKKGSGNTLIFSAKDIRAMTSPQVPAQIDENDVSSTVFVLRKSRFSTSSPNYFLVGRMQPADVVINDYSISRNHAAILIQPGRLVLQDLGSTNGTYYGPIRLEKDQNQVIKPGDGITFGRLEFILTTSFEFYDQITGQKGI